ncbi:rhodanese-like domain-containing protein [Modestobacter muralis]|uniref:Rhodanese-like domain-containing protein n=2 Tax=Modestobacter muralis TaxID=1608614 RepID=A0A6P0EW46_9ACTN|nr:rhodanese-like domain-containing protein [Modestobacter muralis]NEK95150.1 rhodanese-like domain-containing protein [Modestobacter muralis]NEN52038.1 rhodanese-like domain-containing protein [Modestobacter muralis]
MSVSSAVTLVDPAQALALAAQQGTTVIDVRTPDEYQAGHLAGAVNIDVSAETFADQVSALDPAASYVVYCRSGARSAAAAAQMADLGFTDIADAGALVDLTDAGGATETS